MPISTVPKTPAVSGRFTSSPQMRMRLGDPKASVMPEDDVEHFSDTASLMTNTETGVQPQQTTAKRKKHFLAFVTIVVIIGAMFMMVSRETEIVSYYWTKVFPAESTQKTVPATNIVSVLRDSSSRSKGWVYVTGTSPVAMKKGCSDFDAKLANDNNILRLETAESLIDAFLARASAGEATVLCGPPPRTMSELTQVGARIIVYVEDGLWAAFDPGYVTWTHLRGVERDIEEAIDESCLKRRIATRRKYSCTITEIPVLRAASIWRRLLNEAQELGNRVEILQLSSTDLENSGAVKIYDRSRHVAFITQLYEDHLKIPMNQSVLESLPEQPLGSVVDAGYCRVLKSGTVPDAKAVCLPNFIIIGAQKSGSDEVSVWLNRNKYNRRMDGGVEIHFFDCVGRGQGEDRFSCDRRRNFAMQVHQHGTFEVYEPNSTSAKSGTYFSWSTERTKGPFLDDIWRSYLRLGHLGQRQYYLEPSRTLVFEKTPSYLDIADPRDVVRLIPRAKFIIITRDPVQRLLSSYFQFCDTPDAQKAVDGPCSIEQFSEFARQLCHGTLDITTPGPLLKRRQAFLRAVQHGEYINHLDKWTKYFWVGEDLQDKQFLVVDHHHFRFTPLAVMYAIESFLGLHGPIRHYKYTPTFKNGYYVLGDYSKALRRTHPEDMPKRVREALKEYYRPTASRLRELLLQPHGPVVYGLPLEDTFPMEYRTHPDLFVGNNRFNLPPWLKMKELNSTL